MLFAVIGGLYSYDQRKANAADVLVMRQEIQLLYKQFQDDQDKRRARDIESRLWTLEQRYENQEMPVSVKEEVFRLNQELKDLRTENK